MTVYVLILNYGPEYAKIEGVYSSYEKAERAFIDLVRSVPSVVAPSDCEIEEFKVNI